MTTTTEQQLFQDQNVLVSTTRLIVNGTTYPLSNVSSVRLSQRKPNYLGAIVLTLLGLALLAGDNSVKVTGIIMLIIGIALFFVLKSTYTMLIGSAGGEKSALMSKNRDYMSSLVEHINQAIIDRG